MAYCVAGLAPEFIEVDPDEAAVLSGRVRIKEGARYSLFRDGLDPKYQAGAGFQACRAYAAGRVAEEIEMGNDAVGFGAEGGWLNDLADIEEMLSEVVFPVTGIPDGGSAAVIKRKVLPDTRLLLGDSQVWGAVVHVAESLMASPDWRIEGEECDTLADEVRGMTKDRTVL